MNCRVCFRDHPEEHYRCAACGARFKCPSLTTVVTLGNGRVLRGHSISRYSTSGPDNDTTEACGPVGRMVPAQTNAERPAITESMA